MKCNGWINTTIGQIGSVVGGGTPSTQNPDYYDGDIPWITPKDLSDLKTKYIWRGSRLITEQGLKFSSARMLPAGAILLSSRAPIGYVAIAKRAVCTNQGFKSIIPNIEICINEFVYYWLINNKDLLISNASGTTFLEISGGVLKNIEIALPPLSEQHSIARILSCLDDKIELNNRMNKTLEEIAQALFKRWFVDYEFPDENGNPYKSSGGKMVDSELGMIPEGWATEPLYDFAEYINGTSFRKSEMNPDGIPIIKIAEIKNGVSESTERFVGVRDKKLYLKQGDVLFPWSGNPDTSIGVFFWTYKPRAVLNQHIFKVVTPEDSKEFVFFMLKYFIPQFSEIARNKQTTGLGHVTVADLKRLLFVKPSKAVIIYFQRLTSHIYNRILISLYENIDLAKLRDTLLPKLMSGEIRVSEMEAE